MANVTVTYTFVNGNTSDGDEVNQNFTDIINGTSDGTKDFSISALTVAGVFTANGACTLGNATSDDITITGSIAGNIPIKTGTTPDIGSTTIGLGTIYLEGNSQTVGLLASASTSATWTLTMPVSAGTKGDILHNNGSGVLAWVPGQTDIHAVSEADYTVLDDDGYRHIQVTTGNSDRTITLPTASANTDRILTISKVDSGTGDVIVDGEGAEEINGSTTDTYTEQYDSASMVCTGTEWLYVDYLKRSKWQKKILASDLTTNTNLYAETVDANFIFTLEVGKTYRISYQFRIQDGNADGVIYARIRDNTTNIASISGGVATNSWTYHQIVQGSVVHTMASTSLRLYQEASGTTAAKIHGDGSVDETWMIVEELADHAVTTGF